MSLRLNAIHVLLSLWLISMSVHVFAADEEPEFVTINAANGLADNSAQVIICTKTGRMIISTIGNLNFYDGASFTHIDTQQDYQYELSSYRGNYRLYFDHFHHIWLKNTHSVTCVDLLMEEFTPDVEGVIRQLGCEGRVLDVFTDQGGNAWFLTDKGLYDVDRQKTFQILKDRNLQEVDVYNDMLLTFYDNGEVIGLNVEDGQIVHRSKAYEWDKAQQYTTSTIIKQYKDTYFVIKSGENGSVLLSLDIQSHQWSTIMELPYHLNGMALKGDSLYIASARGYWIHDIALNRQRHVENPRLVGGRQLSINCHTIMFDRQGGLWLGTEKRGVLYARPHVSPFRVYSLEDPKAREYIQRMSHITQNISEFNGKQSNCMFEDSRGYTWFGTTVGLFMFRKAQSEPVVFTKSKGLLNNVIHSIVEDRSHNIWVSTSCGISCILFKDGEPDFVNSFSLADNVPNEAFINCKSMCLDDGTIIMQSIDHVVEFNPDRFRSVNQKQDVSLYPKLVRILVNGNFVSPGQEEDGNVIINRAITRVKDISLNSNQNSLSLTFSALNYFRPLQSYYRVRVSGVGDNQWKVYSYFNGSGLVDGKGMLHLPLSNLKPGDYTVEVMASMFPDQWDDTVPFECIVHVNQPWWQATGVYVLFVLMILSLLVVNLFIFGRNTRMRAKRNSEEGDIIKKVNSFVERCENYRKEVLTPSAEELFFAHHEATTQLAPEFITVMLSVMPYVQEHQGRVTMRELSKVSNTDIVKLYNIMTTNLYKSPREIALLLALQKGAELLSSTEMSVEQIANECRFHSPNYFMGSFFHAYKVTPREYREDHR